MTRIPNWLLIVFVLLLAGLVRVGSAVVWQARLDDNQLFAWGDSGTYWEIAQTWQSTGDYQFGEPPQRIFRAPGYPAVLAAAMWGCSQFGGELTVLQARLLGCCLGTLAVWLLVAWTTDLTGDRRSGLLAGTLMAIEPGAIAMSVFVLAEAVFIPLMVLSLWAWTVAWRQKTFASLMLAGVLVGVLTGTAILVRPSWLLFAPVVCGLGFLVYGQRLRQILVGLTVGLGIIVAMSPWWYRNYELTGRWVPTTLQIGASLYDGWNPNADGSSDMTHGYVATRPLFLQYRQQIESQITNPDYQGFPQAALELELSSNDHLQSLAWQWGRENPGQLVKLFFVKVWRTWRPWPAANEVNSWSLAIISVISFLPLFLLGIAGAWQNLNRDYVWGLCFWPAIYVTVLHGVFVGSLRYRQPAMIPLIVLAAVFFCSMFKRKADLKSS